MKAIYQSIIMIFVILMLATCANPHLIQGERPGHNKVNSSQKTAAADAAPANTFTRGKTYLLIGQTFKDEYAAYVNKIGTAPAGSSHYAELYSGEINQGDDAFGANYLRYINDHYPDAHVMIAISIKDNPEAGGYGSINPNSPNYDPSAVYKALKDINQTTKWNDEIDALARKFAQYPGITFYVRLGYEVSMGMFANKSGVDWNQILIKYSSQGINILENPHLAPEIDLSQYKNAFVKMANRIRAIAPNCQFLYHPVRGISDTIHLYPGSKVDWAAFSVFNHDVCIPTDEPNGHNVGSGRIDDNLKKSIEWAKGQGKPVCIAESAFQVPPGGQTTTAFKDYLDRVSEMIYNYDIGLFTYINSDWPAHNWGKPWGDSRVEIKSGVKSYWISQFVNNSRFIQYQAGVNPGEKPFDTAPSQVTVSSDSNGKARAVVAFQFPGSGYKVGSWGTVNKTGHTFTVNILTYQNTSAGQTSVSHTYALGTLAEGNYSFVVKVWDKQKKVKNFTIEGGPGPSGDKVPGMIAENIGSIANGQSKSYAVDVTAAGNYKLMIRSNSAVNSQLIDVTFNGQTTTQAIDAGSTITTYFFNVPAGSNNIKITARSSQVSLDQIDALAN